MKKIPDELLNEFKNLKEKYEQDKDNVQNNIEIADFYLDNDLYLDAINEYLDILMVHDKTSLYIKLAYCYLKINNHDAALECFAKCKYDGDTLDLINDCFINTYNKNSEIYLIERYILHIEEKFNSYQISEVFDILNYLLELPLNDYSLYIIGKTCFNYNQYEEAIKFFTNCLDKFKVDIVLYYRSQAYLHTKQSKMALKDINELLINYPNDLDYIYLKGQIFLSYLEYEQAYEEFKKIINDDETFKEISYFMSLTCNKLCKNNEALEHIDKSLDKSKTYEKVYLKSKIYYNELLYDKSFELTTDLLALNENIEIVLYILELCLQLNYFEEGISYGIKYQLYNKNIKYNNYMAKFYYNTQQYKKSLDHYKIVFDDNNYHQDKIYYYAGICCEKLNNISQAIEYYKLSLTYNKDNKSSNERLDYIERKTTTI